jgi:phosphohistidine phosphatase
MQVYLLRHGTAEAGRAGESDSDRLLTPVGEQEIRQVAAAAKLAHVCPSLVLSSPYKRARRTAEIAAELLDCKEPVLTSNAVTPDASPREVWDEVRAHGDEESLLLVGHEPLFSACAAFLLGAPDLRIDFPKGGLIYIDLEAFHSEPRGILKWLISPQLTV